MSLQHLFAAEPRGGARSQRDITRWPRPTPGAREEILTAISDGLVKLLTEFYGCGPTHAKSYYEDDLVVCVLRGGFTRIEQTLLDGGRGAVVIEQRREFRALMLDRFIAVIEDATSQRVIGFMSGNQESPHMMCEVFILAPAEIFVGDDPPPC
jgi:uncharacterized protein YbcI